MKESSTQYRPSRRVGIVNYLFPAALGLVLTLAAPTFSAAQERVDLNRSSQGLYEIQGGPIEGDRVDLQGRYRSFLYATKDADGNLHVGCQDDHPHDSQHEHGEVAE